MGTASGDGEPALVLQGHVDVVPVGDLANWPGAQPFSAHIANGVLHGRGACDMKAGMAVNLAVARALHRSGVRTERRLALHSVVSEEDGGLGAFATLRRGHRGEVAVITEPTSGRLVTANAGALTFRIEVTGRAAHGSTRQRGRLGARGVLAGAPRPARASRRAATPTRTRCSATTRCPTASRSAPCTRATGPARCPTCSSPRAGWACVLGEDPRARPGRVRGAVAAAAAADPWLRDHAPRVTWPGGQFASGQLPEGHPLVDEVADAVEAVSGRRPAEAAAPYGSDLRLYTGVGGIPTLHYGPGDVRLAHAPRESVPVAEVVQVARALALVAARRLGAH